MPRNGEFRILINTSSWKTWLRFHLSRGLGGNERFTRPFVSSNSRISLVREQRFEQTRRNSRTRNLFIFLGRFFRVALEAVLTIGRFIRSPRTRLSPNDERDFDSSHATWANSLHHTVHAEKRNGWEEGGGGWVKRQLCGGEKRVGGAKGKRRRTNSVESRQRTIGGSLSPCIVPCRACILLSRLPARIKAPRAATRAPNNSMSTRYEIPVGTTCRTTRSSRSGSSTHRNIPRFFIFERKINFPDEKLLLRDELLTNC